MAPLRVLILAPAPDHLANYREMLASGDGVRVVADPGLADVTLVDLTTREEPAGEPDGPGRLYLVSEETPALLLEQLRSTGESFLTDRVSREQLLQGLRAVASGLSVREPDRSRAAPVRADLAVAEGSPLTDREREILRLLGDGMANHQIARALGVSDHTVKFHLRSIFAKLGARTRTEAVSLAVRSGLLML